MKMVGKKIQITVGLEPRAIELIDYYAEKVGCPRGQMVRNLIMNGLDDAKIMNAMGVFDLIKVKNFLKNGHQRSLPLGQD